MQYLCLKQITAGGKAYCPGEAIPDGVILPERSGKLLKSGYISKLGGAVSLSVGAKELFTQEEVADMIEKALAEKLEEEKRGFAELQAHAADLEGLIPGAWEGTVQIPVKCASEGDQMTAVLAKPEEIQQAFSILQMNAEEGAKEISSVGSENVLTLLHAADSRVTIKNAAKKRADSLFLSDKGKEDAGGGVQSAKGIAKENGVMASGGGEA